jgi:hypothetical protein
MDRKPTEQVATIGINIGKNRFHLIGLEVRLGSVAVINQVGRKRPLSGVRRTFSGVSAVLKLQMNDPI